MAISSCERQDLLTKHSSRCQKSSMPTDGDHILSGDSSKTMNNSKKSFRKPEMERYRPGMGLQSKVCKVSEYKIGLEKDLSLEIVINSVSQNDSQADSSTARKSRTRRPTLQVYTPKPKIAAQIENNKSNESDTSSKLQKDKETVVKRLTSSSNKNSSADLKSKVCENGLNRKAISKNSNCSSPLTTDSWADIMDESDISKSKTPSEEESKAVSVTSPEAGSSRNNNRESKRASDTDHNRRHRGRKSSTKNGSNPSNQQKVSESMKSKSVDSNKIEAKIQDNSPDGDNTRTNKRFSRNRHSSDNVDSRGSVSKSTTSLEGRQSAEMRTESEFRSDMKKPEKVESLPPRFQKMKMQNSESVSNGHSNIGGILKLPIEAPVSLPDFVESNFYPSKISEPAFIPKQLFNPNNPSKPQIVKIPAPVPFSNFSPPKFSYVNGSYSSYVPPPVPSVGYVPVPNQDYIPPPKPTALYSPFVPDPESNCRSNYPTCMDSASFAAVHPNYRTPGSYSDIPPEQVAKRRLKPVIEKNLYAIVPLEKELATLLAKGYSESNTSAIKQCRFKLQMRYETIILEDPKYSAEKNPEQSLWKVVFHQMIELLRKDLDADSKAQAAARDSLMNIIIEGTMFYENLLEKQQEKYGFKLCKILEMAHLGSTYLPEVLRCVMISVQKSLIYLGDLTRYKEQVNQTSNFGKARSYYLKAQQLAPKNGRPYNQLAILANNTKRKLDAVYYYMRSLAASNPFLSAKESLLTLFEESKKKFEQYEKKRVEDNAEEVEIVEENRNERVEIWIKNDGSTRDLPADKIVDTMNLKNMSDVELNKKFVTSFLHVHGKLFTKIGMETFPDVLKIMLKEFYALLQRSPLPITSTRILQILAINVFSVTNSSLKENGREKGNCSVLQEQTLYTSMAMASLLMDRCHVLHLSHRTVAGGADKMVGEDLAQLLPAVKIWTDWMSCHKALWAPAPRVVSEKLDVGLNIDVWGSFAKLLSVLQDVDISSPLIMTEMGPNMETVVLEEDSTFSGFVPLMEALHNPAFVMQSSDKEKAKHCIRINRIQFFGDYLCGIQDPYLKFEVESKRFVSLVSSMSFEESFERCSLRNSLDESGQDDDLDVSLEEEKSSRLVERDELQDLWTRKEALSKAKRQQEKQKAQVQAALQNCRRPILLKIRPRYLIPDTNCFIDHLNHFRHILVSTDYHVVIPLVVINELDGLARGNRVNGHSTPEHMNRVTNLSREAVNFLEQEFASRHPHLRAITSKGSILDTISFRSEEMGKNKGTNDDLILTCCLNYCKDRAENYMPKNRDDPITLFREVVLLTDDRNLRVKALAHHVPVRDLLSFLQWANS